jgi:chromosome segregation ATPase
VEDSEYDRRLAAYDVELAELREQAKLLEEEVLSLRRKLQDAPKRVRTLEERLLESKGQLAQAVSQNEKLSYTLREGTSRRCAKRSTSSRSRHRRTAWSSDATRTAPSTCCRADAKCGSR